jgi:hypothetical protein
MAVNKPFISVRVCYHKDGNANNISDVLYYAKVTSEKSPTPNLGDYSFEFSSELKKGSKPVKYTSRVKEFPRGKRDFWSLLYCGLMGMLLGKDVNYVEQEEN